MNMQAMLKQAQKMQADMLKEKNEIDNKEFATKSGVVTVVSLGNKNLLKVSIDQDVDDIELLQDMFVVAVNENNKKIDRETEEKLGKYTKGMPGLF
ncbi:MAG: YbaB/EbfC family nucleoid-associated protein [Bacilli bacterium]|nr:YbaB/EbfC family nucleoid-associated protein [Bacilli bacterium]